MANTNLNPTDINATVADGTATGGTSPSPNATFKERVEAMITYSLDTTTTPTLLQLNHFKQDAVKYITFKWIAIKPFDAYFGRGGDTELRDVGGVESHVNSFEAHLIDKYGEFGESIVKKIGSGTVNPTTGKPEYFIDLLLTILI